jgi:hypothetical protein
MDKQDCLAHYPFVLFAFAVGLALAADHIGLRVSQQSMVRKSAFATYWSGFPSSRLAHVKVQPIEYVTREGDKQTAFTVP